MLSYKLTALHIISFPTFLKWTALHTQRTQKLHQAPFPVQLHYCRSQTSSTTLNICCIRYYFRHLSAGKVLLNPRSHWLWLSIPKQEIRHIQQWNQFQQFEASAQRRSTTMNFQSSANLVTYSIFKGKLRNVYITHPSRLYFICCIN